MATWNDVRRLALALPAVEEGSSHGSRAWRVKGKQFAWERPLRKSDLAALGERAPKGAILGVRTVDLHEKETLVAADPRSFFTTPHFDGYCAVLIPLDSITLPRLRRAMESAWRSQAPAKLARSYSVPALQRRESK